MPSRGQPLGIEAALTAMKNLEREHSEKRLQLDNALEQARFEAARAYRQYDASDPENRLVTAELERRWNERLVAVRSLEDEISRLNIDQTPAFSSADRERLLLLGEDLSRAWNNPEVANETRKKIVRLLIAEIVVDITESTIALIIHWQGGDHTRLEIKKNRAGHDCPPLIARDSRFRPALPAPRSTTPRATVTPSAAAAPAARPPRATSRTGLFGEPSTSPSLPPPAETCSAEDKPIMFWSRKLRNSKRRATGRRGIETISTPAACGEAIQLGNRCVIPSVSRTSRCIVP